MRCQEDNEGDEGHVTMPAAATRQVRQPTRSTGGGRTDRRYPLIGGLSPGCSCWPFDAAARRPGRLLDHELLRIGQVICPVDQLIDLLLEYVYPAGGRG